MLFTVTTIFWCVVWKHCKQRLRWFSVVQKFQNFKFMNKIFPFLLTYFNKWRQLQLCKGEFFSGIYLPFYSNCFLMMLSLQSHQIYISVVDIFRHLYFIFRQFLFFFFWFNFLFLLLFWSDKESLVNGVIWKGVGTSCDSLLYFFFCLRGLL